MVSPPPVSSGDRQTHAAGLRRFIMTLAIAACVLVGTVVALLWGMKITARQDPLSNALAPRAAPGATPREQAGDKPRDTP